MADKERDPELEEQTRSEDDTEVRVNVKGLDSKIEDIEEPETAEDDKTEPQQAEPEEDTESDGLDDLESKLKESEDRYLRLAAEYDNFRKRTAKQFASISESAIEDFALELLNILDNFERALSVDTKQTDAESLKKGVELIFGQLADLFKKKGVEPFDSVGEEFDPNYHEAMMTVETDEHEDGTVVSEFSKGYRLKDKVLRHAKVSVAKDKD
jgi:molecular chaperone GrpE